HIQAESSSDARSHLFPRRRRGLERQQRCPRRRRTRELKGTSQELPSPAKGKACEESLIRRGKADQSDSCDWKRRCKCKVMSELNISIQAVLLKARRCKFSGQWLAVASMVPFQAG